MPLKNNSKIRLLVLIIFALLFSSTASAHEYWLEPETFHLKPNEKTAVHLYVGDGLTKDREERPFQSAKTTRFDVFSIGKTLDLKTSLKDEVMPVCDFSAARTGEYLLTMERRWSFIKIESAKFEDYLREEGMEYIIGERAKLNENQKEGRERYSRFIKSLVQVGDKRDETYKKIAGLKLEIVPQENPYSKKIGDSLKFQVLFDGKPIAGRKIFADNRDGATQELTTDKNGKAAMKIERKGLWLVRVVNMRRCAAADCGEADWESFWSAFTFGV